MLNKFLNLTLSAVMCMLLSSCCTNRSCSGKDVALASEGVDDLESNYEGNATSSNETDPANINFSSEAGNRVFFDFDRQDLTQESEDILSKQAEWLVQNPHKVIVEGYCDDRGTSEYNIGLGNRRANSVKDYLISKGVPAEYIEVISFGKDKPIEIVGSIEEVRRQNRVALTIINESVAVVQNADPIEE